MVEKIDTSSSGPPSEYSNQSLLDDIDEAEFGDEIFYMESLPASEDKKNEAFRVRYGKARDREITQQRQQKMQQKVNSVNNNTQRILEEVSMFTAGAIKYNTEDENKKYVQKMQGVATSDSESQEEVKGDGIGSTNNPNAEKKNSLSDIMLDEVAPTDDVKSCFFGDKKKPDGSNRYSKI